MARQQRIHVHGGIYHVMLRGNGGMEVFASDEDRCRFLLLLQEGSYRFGFRVHAFCLMSNHVHLAIQVSDVPLSNIMQNLSFRYTRWFNFRQKRLGHLFQGRFKAILIDQNTYFLALIRYIHLNPVRAEMVKDASDYDWSGHNAYLGDVHIPWLTTDYLLGQLADSVDRARECYHEFVQAGMEEDHAKIFHQRNKDARLLGDDDFMEMAYAKAKTERSKPPALDDIVRVVTEHYELEPSELEHKSRAHKPSEARNVIAWLCTETGAATLTKVAEKFQRDLATISGGSRRIRRLSLQDDQLRKLLDQLLSQLPVK
ncbi:MAG: transposase [Mariprofundaceae bacterium]|nr:transposase [Mariprofundaceae bacterium]